MWCDADDDGEYMSRLDTGFIPATTGTFPWSDDWETVAAAIATDLEGFDGDWPRKHQRFIEEDAAALEEE